MIYELLDTDAHPLVVIGTLENHPDTEACECGSSHHKALKIVLEGAAPIGMKAMGLLTAVNVILADSATSEDDRRVIRRSLAKILELSS